MLLAVSQCLYPCSAHYLFYVFVLSIVSFKAEIVGGRLLSKQQGVEQEGVAVALSVFCRNMFEMHKLSAANSIQLVLAAQSKKSALCSSASIQFTSIALTHPPGHAPLAPPLTSKGLRA